LAFRGRSEAALTAFRTSWSLRTLQEQTIMGTKTILVIRPHRYGRALGDAKGKAAFSSNSKLMPDEYWNESKQRCCGKSNSC
jgi:hypothetical protein